MKNPSAAVFSTFAAAILATVFSWSAVSAAGSVEDLKPASPVPAAEQAAAERSVRPGRTVFDEFSVIGDPLYRKGSMELLKKAVESGSEEKPAAAKEKAAPPAAGEVKAKAVPAKRRPPTPVPRTCATLPRTSGKRCPPPA